MKPVRPRYHIRWKIILWGVMIVMISILLSWAISPLLANALNHSVPPAERGRFMLWISQGLTAILSFVIAVVLMIFTSKTMVNRVLALSLAAKEIAAGNFSVRVSEVDRHDEVYQLALDFNTMAEQLQHNEYMRKDFISNVSHEIKTPLSVINGYADLLQEELPPEEQREYAAAISRESQRLLHLSQNMLRISQLDNARINSNQTRFRLDEQLRQAVLFMEPKWTAKGIDLDVDLPVCTCLGNEELLVQVWINLLDNAIKFSPEGGRVRIRLVDEAGPQVTIEDEGPGMDAETRERIYEQFYQGDHSRIKEGAGLGMSIVRRIVDLHKGTIDIQSAPGEGTRITVGFPKRKD